MTETVFCLSKFFETLKPQLLQSIDNINSYCQSIVDKLIYEQITPTFINPLSELDKEILKRKMTLLLEQEIFILAAQDELEFEDDIAFRIRHLFKPSKRITKQTPINWLNMFITNNSEHYVTNNYKLIDNIFVIGYDYKQSKPNDLLDLISASQLKPIIKRKAHEECTTLNNLNNKYFMLTFHNYDEAIRCVQFIEQQPTDGDNEEEINLLHPLYRTNNLTNDILESITSNDNI